MDPYKNWLKLGIAKKNERTVSNKKRAHTKLRGTRFENLVSLDGIVEEDRILRYDADGLADGRLRHSAHVLTVEQNGALVHVEHAEQQPDDGRFAFT